MKILNIHMVAIEETLKEQQFILEKMVNQYQMKILNCFKPGMLILENGVGVWQH
jgi:hypothetical protein